LCTTPSPPEASVVVAWRGAARATRFKKSGSVLSIVATLSAAWSGSDPRALLGDEVASDVLDVADACRLSGGEKC